MEQVVLVRRQRRIGVTGQEGVGGRVIPAGLHPGQAGVGGVLALEPDRPHIAFGDLFTEGGIAS